ncbi:MAG: hypothetical protein IPJ09_08575 [Saprospiraceae bacterium]|nr:hypothetical protein [Saprospiraceae bacterium]
MQIAIEEAMKGIQNGEGGPFGAVIVKNDQILVRAHNTSEKQKITTLHLPLPESNQPFTWWAANGDKTLY